MLGFLARLDSVLCSFTALLEAERLIAGFDDVAVMGQSIQQSGGQLGVDKHAAPFRERQIGGNDDAGSLVEFGKQVKQQCTAGLREGQIAKLIQNDQVHLHQAERQLALLACGLLLFQHIGQIYGGIEACSFDLGMPETAIAVAR
jgi:hypothetical protein